MTNHGLLVERMDPPPDLEEELNDWYESEHLREVQRVSGILTTRRAVRDRAPRYLACYDLESPAVELGEHGSPWAARLRKKTRLFERRVYEQISPGRARVVETH